MGGIFRAKKKGACFAELRERGGKLSFLGGATLDIRRLPL